MACLKKNTILGNDNRLKLQWQPHALVVAAATCNMAKTALTDVNVDDEVMKSRKNNVSSDVIINKTANIEGDDLNNCNAVESGNDERVLQSVKDLFEHGKSVDLFERISVCKDLLTAPK